MTETIIGKVMMTFRGEYDADTSYTYLDEVTYDGSTYLCRVDVTGILPTDTDHWTLLAKAGRDGKDGINGKDGAPGKDGKDGAPGKNGFYHYTVDLTDAKYDRNKWYYVEANTTSKGSLWGLSYFSLEAPLYSGIDVPYGYHRDHPSDTSKDACARQAVLYGQGGWGAYDRKLIVLDDDTNFTTDGKRLLTFVVPSDNNLNYGFYARGGLKINIASDVSRLIWTPHTDTFIENGTTISVLSDAPDPRELGLDDNHTFWALPISKLKQQLPQGPQGLPGKDGVTPHIDSTTGDWFVGSTDTGIKAQGPQGEAGVPGTNGKDGIDGKDGEPGRDGTDGKNAYQIWLDNGHSGTETDFLNSLKGAKGDPGKDGQNGTPGTNGKNGADGKSTYQIWLDNGHTGTETDFLNSLKGKDGTDVELSGYATTEAVQKAQSTADNAYKYSQNEANLINKRIDNIKVPTESDFNQVKTITSGTLADLATTQGSYHYEIDCSPSDSPVADWGLLDVVVGANYAKQVFTSTANSDVYVRTRKQGVWSAWRQITLWN